MRPSLPSSFAKIIFICCFAILAGSSAVGQTALGFTQAPDHVGVSPEGCRNNGGLTLQQSGKTFICTPDTVPPSDPPYTGGELGKNWAELDLVPFKLTTSRASDSTTPTYNVIIAGDNQQGGTTGYDFITVPILDPNLPSDSSCTVADANAGDANNGLEVATGVTGGTNTTIYRTLTIMQGPGTNCYFAYDQRLAIGSHLFNGSNLQAYTFESADFKTGKQTIPIQVKQCKNGDPTCVPTPAPQTISKDMTATVPVTTMWALTGTGPNNISGNTCVQNQLTQSPLKFTITWTATQSSSGGVNIVTHVYATNPAAVPIQVQITDRIYPGTDPSKDNDPFIVPPGPNNPLDTDTGSFVVVPANTMNQLVLTHTYNDPSGSVGTGYNDIAVGSYEDADGNQVPGNTFAQASATATSGLPTNTTATINNQESISPNSLNFSTDSVTPSDASVTGTFAGGYTLGTEIPLNFNQPLSWTSNTQDASTVESLGGAGVTFSKSVYLPLATAVTGTLTDSATLTDSNSNTINMQPSLNVTVTGAPQLSLEIDKTLSVAVGTDQTFTFKVMGTSNNSTPASITIPAGMTTGKTTVMGLTPDNYTVTEDPNPLWTNDGPHSVNLSPDPNTGAVTCTGSKVVFVNTIVNQDLTVSKTATASFTRKYTWGITKAVDQTTIDTNGAGATFNYTVNVTHDSGTDSAWQVTGLITVNNPNQDDFTGVNVTDSIDNGGTCVVTNGSNVTVPAGGSVQLSYTCTYASAPAPNSFTNTATATWSSSYGAAHTSGSGAATGDFSTVTPTLVDDSVTVTDTFGGTLGTVLYTDPSPKTFKYSHTFTGDPAGTCTSHNNTATFTTDTTGTTGSASQSVQVCVGADLTVSKTATASFSRTYNWSIAKNVDKTTVTTTAGGQVQFNYEVDANETGVTDSGWLVSGTITVTNPNDWEAITASSVADSIDNGGNCSVTGGTNVSVPKSGSVTLNYTCTYTAAPSPLSGTNTASATWSAATYFTPNGSAKGTVAYAFGSPSSTTNKTITVTDTFDGSTTTLGTLTATDTTPFTSQAYKYSHTVTAPNGTCNTHNNTAKITETGQSASQSVKVCGGADLTVSKTATPAFTRTYNWGITKSATPPSQTTSAGGNVTFNYTVVASETGFTDSGWGLTGTITVTNPNDWEAITANVTDGLTGCTVSGGTGVVVAAGKSVNLSYSCTFTSAVSGPNSATATWDPAAYFTPDGSATGTAAFSFSTPTPVNQTTTPTDSFNGGAAVNLCTLQAGTPCTLTAKDTTPYTTQTYTYSRTVAAGNGTCVTYNNTAAITGATAGASVQACGAADLKVSKTASVSIPTYTWSINKAVSPNGTVESSSTVTLNYTVTASFTKTGSWQVTGTITVSNPNTFEDITGVNVTDSIDNNGTCSVTNGTNVTVPKSSSVNLSYTCTYSAAPSPTSGTNTATATWVAATFHTLDGSAKGTAPYNFSPLTNGPTTITVTDAFNGGAAITLGTVNALTNTTTPNTNPATDGGLTITSPSFGVFKYSRKITPIQGQCKTYNNTATIVETGATFTASVTICGTNTGALTMGFWQNKNGQGIITGGASTGGVCNSGTFLRTYAPFQDLSATANCSAVASYVFNIIKAANAAGSSMNAMLKAQMLATALDVYFSDPALGGNKIGAPAPIGGVKIDLTKVCSMIDSSNGTGTCSGTYLNASSAFGGATTLTVSQILAYAASQSNAGGSIWYGQNKTIQGLAKNTFDSINNQAATIAP